MNVESTGSQVFYKIGLLKNFAKFTGKHLCWRPAASLKGDSNTVFPREFSEIFKNMLFTEHLRATASEICSKLTIKTTELSYNTLINSSNQNPVLLLLIC